MAETHGRTYGWRGAPPVAPRYRRYDPVEASALSELERDRAARAAARRRYLIPAVGLGIVIAFLLLVLALALGQRLTANAALGQSDLETAPVTRSYELPDSATGVKIEMGDAVPPALQMRPASGVNDMVPASRVPEL
jgi:hypothetical protein